MNRLKKLIWFESMFLIKTKTIIYLLGVFITMLVLSIVFPMNFNSDIDYKMVLGSVASVIIQFLGIGLIGLLCNLFYRDKKFSYHYWFIKHKITITDIVRSRFIFYNILFSLLAGLMFIASSIIFIFMYEVNISFYSYLYMLVLVILSTTYVVSLMIMISALVVDFVSSSGLFILIWFTIGIINGVTPYLGGYLSPLDASSVQSGVISEISGIGSNFIAEIDIYSYLLALLLPVIYAFVFYLISIKFNKYKRGIN